MALQANNRNGTRMLLRNDRNMPSWVAEQSGRIGPTPPPPPITTENGHAAIVAQPQIPPKTKTQPEPDYEVIEFSHQQQQQYSNTPLRPTSALSGSKTPDSKLKCTLCGSNMPWVTCEECGQQIFCASCDDMYHKHPKRKNHQRKTLEQNIPPLPPKVLPGQPGPAAPVAPPRRGKRGMMTPLMQRKDQVVDSSNGTFTVPPSPSPSLRNAAWHEGGADTLKRANSMFNRPLPETPNTPTSPSESSRCGTPKSIFDNIQKPPSVVLEKIKNKANATLDRMQLLQQRYRQQKDQMERDRSGSALEVNQNLRAFDQWSNISPSPSHFRSGSMSSGINSSHLDLTDDSSFNLFHQRQLAKQHHQMAAKRANQLGQRGMSSSVFNLNQVHGKPPLANSNGWMNNSMQQAQSVAQLNCMNCTHPSQATWAGQQQHMHMHHQDPWSNRLTTQQHLNHSNQSLNIGPGFMMQHPHNGMYPPPVFMNQHPAMGPMYPQPYMGGMPVMNPGLAGMPPSSSRVASRAGSRMASPAMSRKSVTLRRKQRASYREDEGTDDEDSDEDDRRSLASNRSGVTRNRQRRISSASQFQVDDDLDAAAAKLRSRVRSQRRDSTAKSVNNDWAPGRKASTGNNRSVDSGFNSPLKPSRIYSDLDSEGSGTRALVQAKIQQKLKEDNLKQQKQSKSKRRSISPPPKQKQISAAVQTPVVQPKKEKKEEKPTAVMANGSEDEYEMVEEEVTDDGSEVEDPENNNAGGAAKSQTANGPTSEEQLDVTNQDEEDAVSLGPPPKTPDQEWECEFCTFVNEPNIKICTICCKTPCKPPKVVVGKSASPPTKQVKASTVTKEQNGTLKKIAPKTNDTATFTNKTQSSLAALTLNDTASELSDEMNDTNTVSLTEQKASQPTTNTTTTTTTTKKESVDDIWATLDEDIQATAHEVTRKAETAKKPTKVSTGCGTSTKSASVERQDVELCNSQAREIGTSPPPQTISTQTYDTISFEKSETKDESSHLPSVNSSQPLANDTMQQSDFTTMSNKIRDMKSFENEVLNNIHNISHVPPQYQHPHHQQHPYYLPHERNQRYRSSNDLRMDDTMSVDFDSFNGMGRRHPSISELLLLQRTSSQMHSPLAGSSYDLSSYRHNGMDNHKESDLYKYTAEELNAALKYCGPEMHPLIWLRDNWPKLIQTVQSLATKYGQERAENTIGTISQMEAREALRLHTGNIWQAVSECIEQRQRKYREISNKGNFSREDVVTALTTHQGNVDLALMDLGRTQLKPFLMRIWGSPGGVENESGAMMLPPSSQSSLNTPYTMDKDIHNFLSANASDCMQTPAATPGAFTPTNQMPSPFDLPAPLEHSYDINNTMNDNTSSYSADSKDYGTSPPPPVDEAILNNKSMLKDLESLIGTMEQNQQKQNEQVLRSIQDMISNMKQDKPDDEYDPETMRILTKSPITSTKLKTTSNDMTSENEADVKSFVWQHIQEIVPNLVQQVEMELREDNPVENKKTTAEESITVEPAVEQPKDIPPPPPPPPIDQDEFLMEEVIKPNLKNASIREELPPQYVYASEISTFQMTFDKGLERWQKAEFKFESLKEAERLVFYMYRAPEAPKPKGLIEVEEGKLEAASENIPATVYSLSSLTPEPPKKSPSPNIPLTIDDVVGGTNDQLPNGASFAIPPDIPPFVDPTLNEDITSETSPSEPLKSEITLELAQALQSDVQLQEATIPSSNVATSSMIPQVNASDLEVTAESLEIETQILNESIDMNQLIEPSDSITEVQLTETVEDLLSVASNNVHDQANDSMPKDPIIKQSQADENESTHDALQQFQKTEAAVSEQKQVTLPQPPLNIEAVKSATLTLFPDLIETNQIISENQTLIPENHTEMKTNEPSVNDSESSNTTDPHSEERRDNTTTERTTTSNTEPEIENDFLAIAATSDTETNASNLPSTSQTAEKSLETQSVQATSNILNSFQKKTSKIPVRRTTSNKSLIAVPVALTKSEKYEEPVGKSRSTSDDDTPASDVRNSATTATVPDPASENDSEEEDLYSIASESFTDFDSHIDDVQSPTSMSNEVYLMIQQDAGESTMDESTIIPSTSSSTVHSATSFSSGLKSPTEFVPSGDPSKQNLSELVMDTQRLIKQMREEINLDDFESSTDEDYSDDYSDEYDDDDDEEEDLEEEEEDGDDDEDWDENDNDDELDDIMDDLPEEDEIEENHVGATNSEGTFDTQDDRDIHNNSVISNASASSKHSQSLAPQHEDEIISVDTKQPQITSSPDAHTMIYIESENQIPEFPVETVTTDSVVQQQQLPQNPEAPFEAENEPQTVQAETALVEIPAASSSSSSAIPISSIPLSIPNPVESENSLPELPLETVLPPVTEPLPLQTENTVPELPSEVVLVPTEPVASSIDTMKSIASDDPIPTPSSVDEVDPTPSTSGISLPSLEHNQKNTKKSSSIAKLSAVKKTNSAENEDKPTSNKGTRANEATGKKPMSKSSSTKKPAVAASKIPKPKETVKEPKPNEALTAKAAKPKTTPPPAQEIKPKESPTTRVYKDPKPRMPTRSKSFSGPPINITSVKTITQRFLNQTKPQTNTVPTPKAPITVARKPSITEAINKLTKPSASTELPSTSSLFRARTQPRIPKKKYHETCFSDDDYGSSTTEEEPEPLEIKQRKMSIPVFRAYAIVQEPEEVNIEDLVDKFMREELVNTVSEAQIAATLVSMKFQQDVSLWAAKECRDLDDAIALLKQECELCSGTYALNQIVSMLKCTHKCCKECAKTYFTVQITERSINDCNCPFCKLPELTNPNEHEDDNLEYFSNLDIYLKTIVEPEVHELFQRKLRDRTLLKDPNFKWCIQCSSGFFSRPKQKRLICPDCGSVTCASCRKTWQKQHEGISCEKFLEWETGNDPEIQALGVKEHLEQNGIDCPKCKFKYSLARGGCMHFTCTQCKYEFCYGCARPFMMGAKCTISPYCAKLGLHAHHPRNCLFYLRDKLPIQIQILLKNNAVTFEVDPIESADCDKPGTSQKQELRCPIPIQKETPNGLVDTKCNGDVPDKHAGMCRTHYVEYLTAKVAKANIDPLPIFDLTDCVQELRRRGLPLPERGPWDTDEIYKTMCAEVIQKQIPLDTN